MRTNIISNIDNEIKIIGIDMTIKCNSLIEKVRVDYNVKISNAVSFVYEPKRQNPTDFDSYLVKMESVTVLKERDLFDLDCYSFTDFVNLILRCNSSDFYRETNFSTHDMERSVVPVLKLIVNGISKFVKLTHPVLLKALYNAQIAIIYQDDNLDFESKVAIFEYFEELSIKDQPHLVAV